MRQIKLRSSTGISLFSTITVKFWAIFALSFLLSLSVRVLSASLPTGTVLFAQGLEQHRAGHYSVALDIYRQALRELRVEGNSNLIRKTLNNIGGCQLASHHHRLALNSFLEARNLSEKAHDISKLGGLNSNICSLYKQMENLDDATTAAEKGLAAVALTHDVKTQAKLQVQLADILGRQNKLPDSLRLFDRAIESAESVGDTETVAVALDLVGNSYRRHGLFPEADRALTEAFRLRKGFRLSDLEWSYMNLADLRADQGDLQSALVLTNAAMALLRSSPTTNPLWSFYYGRGKIYAKKGEYPKALADLRVALQLANEMDVVPSDENRVFLEGDLEPIHAALVDAGTRLYLKTGDTRLVAETFEAAESNRAASLRALLPRLDDWRNRLSSRYWEILPQLQSAERDL